MELIHSTISTSATKLSTYSLDFMEGHLRHRPTCRADFQIAIICALPLEYEAVLDVFDGFWNDKRDDYGKAAGDQNTYTTGWIGQHNVVLVICSDIGKVNATSLATSCKLSFTQIGLALLVGICGVAPQTSDQKEIILGDVIVSRLSHMILGEGPPMK